MPKNVQACVNIGVEIDNYPIVDCTHQDQDCEVQYGKTYLPFLSLCGEGRTFEDALWNLNRLISGQCTLLTIMVTHDGDENTRLPQDECDRRK